MFHVARITTALAAAALLCAFAAQSAEATLQTVDTVGYQINLGSNNKISLSRVASVPLGKPCIASMSVTDPFRQVFILQDRMQAVMDPDPKKPGEFFTRPRQVWAKCEVATCTTPKPADEERPGQCPSGTTGAWTQSLTYAPAAYPTCWTAGEWLPASPPAGACVAPNRPPTISGTPASTATVGQLYTFTPTASDPDWDTLTFALENRPPWGTFDTTTGTLSGTPKSTDVGVRSEIRIRVSDGKGGEAVLAFGKLTTAAALGSVTLSWPPTTQNTDGTPAVLTGYRIQYGASASAMGATIDVNGAGVTSYVVENLSAGSWYFAVRAVAAYGVSDLSPIAAKTIL